MSPNEINAQDTITPRAPDAILAELWEVKREINKTANYSIDILVQMAQESAKCVRNTHE